MKNLKEMKKEKRKTQRGLNKAWNQPKADADLFWIPAFARMTKYVIQN